MCYNIFVKQTIKVFFMPTKGKEKSVTEHEQAGIGPKSFITVVSILTAVLLFGANINYRRLYYGLEQISL